MLPYFGDSCLRKLDGTLLARWQRLPARNMLHVSHTGEGKGDIVWHFHTTFPKRQGRRLGRLAAHAVTDLPVAPQGRQQGRAAWCADDEDGAGDEDADSSGDKAAGAGQDGEHAQMRKGASSGLVLAAGKCNLKAVTGLSSSSFAALTKAGGKPAESSLAGPPICPMSSASTASASSRASSVRSKGPSRSAAGASTRSSRTPSKAGSAQRSSKAMKPSKR